MKNKIETIKLKSNNGDYEFPFEVLDKTPGGQNLGRIQWIVEVFPGKVRDDFRMINKLFVWARQTRDKRYYGKVFEIETYSETITTNLHDDDKQFAPWRMMFCPIHKGAFILDAYPSNSCKKLIINTMSSISTGIRFE